MLNEQFFLNKKDAEIARLKMTIEKFKEYDEKRKKYYAAKMQRLGELESWLDETRASNDDKEIMEAKILNQKEEIKRLQKLIKLYKITDLDDNEVSEKLSSEQLKRRNKKLSEEVKSLKRTLSDLIYKYNTLKEDYERMFKMP